MLLEVAAEDIECQAIVRTKCARIDPGDLLEIAPRERKLEAHVRRPDVVGELGVVAMIAEEGRLERVERQGFLPVGLDECIETRGGRVGRVGQPLA